jgi:regulatory factor X
MEKILLVSLEGYGNTFVEPKVELGARFGHLVCKLFVGTGLAFDR